ncbi:hypothetical protein GN244_ATG17572 [Phytophthora infestans]|uniref:DUF659 domain-containing protein n=1 Tax=Phytophthora infestans TaxID=4787 RepID=A0A833VVM2_PHYIN|nr:hypothetical protein GN244_ATG17572 [Phytophthora infestans]KAF4129932.1 hypothetical protein GN958_ATG20878 [Phytophthora infestans]
MKAAMDILEAKRSELPWSGCAAHVVDLLPKDVMQIQFIKSVLGKARSLTKLDKKRRALLKRFRKTQVIFLQRYNTSYQ